MSSKRRCTTTFLSAMLLETIVIFLEKFRIRPCKLSFSRSASFATDRISIHLLSRSYLHVRMAEMLSFLGNRCTGSEERSRIEFADENYAREIMQLFSIGLTKLQNDGTPVLNNDGVPVHTYTNDEITEYAKVWSGFRLQPMRGNIETRIGGRFIASPLTPLLQSRLTRFFA